MLDLGRGSYGKLKKVAVEQGGVEERFVNEPIGNRRVEKQWRRQGQIINDWRELLEFIVV